MLKATIIALSLLSLAACGTAPAPTRSDSHTFSIISEQIDPAAGSLTLLIRVSGPASQASVKSIVESIIANRNGDYRNILVKSYTEGTSVDDAPFAISSLEAGSVTHRFNAMAENQKIPTH
jgi:glutamate mutase epsilon subunit